MCVCVQHCVRRTNLFEVLPNVLRQFIPNSLQLSQSYANGHNYAHGETEAMQNEWGCGEGKTSGEAAKSRKIGNSFSSNKEAD